MLRSLTRVLFVAICVPAAAPRDSQGRPDLSGIWQRIPPTNMPDNTGFDNGLQYYVPDGFQIPFQPWAESLYKERFRKLEGETFVVDSVGFNDLSWLDDSGHPHTDALHTIERFRRQDFGHMELEVTIDDSKAYTKRWSAKIPLGLLPDTELIEDICANEKDVVHLQVK